MTGAEFDQCGGMMVAHHEGASNQSQTVKADGSRSRPKSRDAVQAGRHEDAPIHDRRRWWSGRRCRCDCVRQPHFVAVVEKAADIYALPRAIVMDDEVQRALTLLGAGGGLADVTGALPGAEFVDVAGTRIIGFELSEGTLTGLGLPLVVRYHQPEPRTALLSTSGALSARPWSKG